jgi:hypothetical protein
LARSRSTLCTMAEHTCRSRKSSAHIEVCLPALAVRLRSSFLNAGQSVTKNYAKQCPLRAACLLFLPLCLQICTCSPTSSAFQKPVSSIDTQLPHEDFRACSLFRPRRGHCASVPGSPSALSFCVFFVASDCIFFRDCLVWNFFVFTVVHFPHTLLCFRIAFRHFAYPFEPVDVLVSFAE